METSYNVEGYEQIISRTLEIYNRKELHHKESDAM